MSFFGHSSYTLQVDTPGSGSVGGGLGSRASTDTLGVYCNRHHERNSLDHLPAHHEIITTPALSLKRDPAVVVGGGAHFPQLDLQLMIRFILGESADCFLH